MSYFGKDFYQNIAFGAYSNIVPWSKIGYTPTLTTAESDIWSLAGTYVFPVTAQQMEVVSGNNADDIGTSIKAGTSTGGTTTSLIDTGANFNAATAVAAGDCVVLDKSGTVPEWGYVTTVTSDTELAVAGGFSSGGTGSGRAYAVIDKSATAGAHVVKIGYLNGSYVEDTEIVILNGTTPVDTVQTDLFRINSFRVIAAGANSKPTGALSLRNTAGTITYSYITAGFTRARNIMSTVPAGKTLYIYYVLASFSSSGSPNKEYARIWTRANIEPATLFNTGSLFYPYTEISTQNVTTLIELAIPTKLPAKTDIKVSGIASSAGVANCVLRGFLVS